jgi:uncharacterized protein YuzE
VVGARGEEDPRAPPLGDVIGIGNRALIEYDEKGRITSITSSRSTSTRTSSRKGRQAMAAAMIYPGG